MNDQIILDKFSERLFKLVKENNTDINMLAKVLGIKSKSTIYRYMNEDARVVSNAIGLKLTDLSPEIVKCGFPIAKLEKYTNLLNSHNISFEVVTTPTSTNQNTPYDNIIKTIQNVDLNNTTCKEAFDILYNIQQKIKNIQ